MREKLIYFLRPIGQPGPIKIGCSRYPENRLVDFLRWSPLPLEIVVSVPGNYAHERRLHAMFREQRLHLEWFTATPALDDLMAKLRAGVDLEELTGDVPHAWRDLLGRPKQSLPPNSTTLRESAA